MSLENGWKLYKLCRQISGSHLTFVSRNHFITIEMNAIAIGY